MSSCLLVVSALPICHVVLSTCSVVLSSLGPRPVRAIRVTRGGLEPTSLTGDVTSEITDDDWERGRVLSTCYVVFNPRPPNTHTHKHNKINNPPKKTRMFHSFKNTVPDPDLELRGGGVHPPPNFSVPLGLSLVQK